MKNNDKETITVEISDKDFISLAKGAHEADITLNQHINNLLLEYANKILSETPEAEKL